MSFLTSFYRQLSSIDLDEVFSYQTTKEVRMLDRRLGMVCWLNRAVVLIYVVGYVFLYREGYTEVEKSVGHAVSSVNGTTYAETINGRFQPFDAIDTAQPALEDGAAFIATTQYLTPFQTMGNWSDLRQPCTPENAKRNCPANPPLAYGKCVGGYCQTLSWGPHFSEADTIHTTKYRLETADNFGVWIRSSIQFPTLDESGVLDDIMPKKAQLEVAKALAMICFYDFLHKEHLQIHAPDANPIVRGGIPKQTY